MGYIINVFFLFFFFFKITISTENHAFWSSTSATGFSLEETRRFQLNHKTTEIHPSRIKTLKSKKKLKWNETNRHVTKTWNHRTEEISPASKRPEKSADATTINQADAAAPLRLTFSGKSPELRTALPLR